jgi:hypothetical protein
MSIQDPQPPRLPSREVLDEPRAYVRLDQDVITALPELGETIRAFVPVPGPAGESVAEWLTDRALREPQEATVRVRLSHGAITGVYALCAAQIALGTEDRAQLGGVHYRTQPAILLAQFARAADTAGIGGEMLEHAARTAQLALHYVGATVLVVDPFDEDTGSYWREHWGFTASEQGVPGNRRLKRLWAAIPR